MIIKSLRDGTSASYVVVRFEDGTKLRVGVQLVAEYGLRIGKAFTEQEWSVFTEAVERWSAKERAVRIAAATNISQKKLARRLVEKGERPDHAEEAVQWLAELHLLDDARTGETIVHSAVSKGYGINRIRQILREKEIPQEYWDELLSDLPPMDDAIDAQLRKKLKHTNPDRKEIQSAVNSLLRYGHTWPDIKAALERFHADADMEEPECL